jgi:hypothetical protein
LTNRVQTIRSAVAGNRPGTGTRAPGELYTNWADLQLGVINAAKQAVDLLAVRVFSSLANYVIGDFVTQGGKLYRAKVAVAPGAFNPANWDTAALSSDPIAGYLPLTGGTLSGALTLAADPGAALQPATKQYVDAQLASATSPFPSGTTLLFYQPAAPPGWTKLTSQNDKAIRVVSGSGGVAGGTNAFSTVMGQANTGNHTLTAAEIPPVTSSGSNNITVYLGGPNGQSNYAPVANASWNGLNTSIGSGYTTPFTGSGVSPTGTNFAQGANNISVTSAGGGGAHNHPITMNIAYLDVILCSKN